MQYIEYQYAAEKHIKACKSMLSMLATGQFKGFVLSQKEQDYVLMDIYYLSGYIFESAVIYGLYKLAFDDAINSVFDYTKSIKDTYYFGQGGAYYHKPPTIKFSFYKKYCDKLHSNTSNISSNYCVSGHKFWNNIELINHILSGNDIPLISDRDDINLATEITNIYALVQSWEPEKRYLLESPPLSYSQVNAIVNLAEQVYLGIIKNT
jgi:hypothetical protein